MAVPRPPETIETEHFSAVYSNLEYGYICLFVCGRCGRRGNTIVRLWDDPIFTRTAVPEGWDVVRNPVDGGAVPRCDTCIAKAADAISDELLSRA